VLESLKALTKTCPRIQKEQPSVGWKEVCAKLSAFLKKPHTALDATKFIETHFTPHLVSGPEGAEGMFTGYYEPAIRASFKKGGEYMYPIYAKPKGLKEGKPYLSRKEIYAGALDGKRLEIAYAADPVELFFMQVQGSGSLLLPDGSVQRVGFAAKNQHPYTSIGRYLIKAGEMKKGEVTAQTLKKWLKDHSRDAQNVMEQNASYIFFRKLEKVDGPIGAAGVSLTPKVSLAIDNAHMPYGSLLWLDTTVPAKLGAAPAFRSLMVAQDTGSAIKGEVRGDVFFGAGEEAAFLAGEMQQQGKYYLLFPKGK
jgi:membrane-bound lytic murein transglycosylase A